MLNSDTIGEVGLDRVMTVSFHKFGDLFFPGTGDVKVTFQTLLFVYTVSAMVNKTHEFTA